MTGLLCSPSLLALTCFCMCGVCSVLLELLSPTSSCDMVVVRSSIIYVGKKPQ